MTAAQLFAYGLLGAPLAAAALPIYLHIPKLYAEHHGVSLALLGIVLFAARLFDALADPLIGVASDRARSRRILVLAGLLPLAIGLVAMVRPAAGIDPLTWLLGTLFLVYAGYSITTINYAAWGAELSRTPALGTRLVASREAWSLIGVVAASVAPGLLSDEAPTGLWRAVLGWLPWLCLAALLTAVTVPDAIPHAPRQALSAALQEVMRHARFRRLLAVFALNGIAAAIPGTLVLFFIADVLQAPEREGLFLALYFSAGVLALPLWTRLADRVGRARSWSVSMVIAIAVFGWAWTLGPGDVLAFALICVGSGIALGADLALPPALLAGLVSRRDEPLPAGGSFGVWTFVTKLNLALAAGVALPALAFFGYRPGEQGEPARVALTAVYALLPLVLKLGAFLLLWNGARSIEPGPADDRARTA
ncbi:MFS transporter [Methyloversatilis sp.]|uniref:MFS transporter n=1 Tax=Methyloversatilis sp. TaxID=2569862 RepID=UPI0035AE466C